MDPPLICVFKYKPQEVELTNCSLIFAHDFNLNEPAIDLCHEPLSYEKGC